MEREMINIRIRRPRTSEDNFYDLRACFAPCLADLSFRGMTDGEKRCADVCLQKHQTAQTDHASRMNQHIRTFNDGLRMREAMKREVQALERKSGAQGDHKH